MYVSVRKWKQKQSTFFHITALYDERVYTRLSHSVAMNSLQSFLYVDSGGTCLVQFLLERITTDRNGWIIIAASMGVFKYDIHKRNRWQSCKGQIEKPWHDCVDNGTRDNLSRWVYGSSEDEKLNYHNLSIIYLYVCRNNHTNNIFHHSICGCDRNGTDESKLIWMFYLYIYDYYELQR